MTGLDLQWQDGITDRFQLKGLASISQGNYASLSNHKETSPSEGEKDWTGTARDPLGKTNIKVISRTQHIRNFNLLQQCNKAVKLHAIK